MTDALLETIGYFCPAVRTELGRHPVALKNLHGGRVDITRDDYNNFRTAVDSAFLPSLLPTLKLQDWETPVVRTVPVHYGARARRERPSEPDG